MLTSEKRTSEIRTNQGLGVDLNRFEQIWVDLNRSKLIQIDINLVHFTSSLEAAASLGL